LALESLATSIKGTTERNHGSEPRKSTTKDSEIDRTHAAISLQRLSRSCSAERCGLFFEVRVRGQLPVDTPGFALLLPGEGVWLLAGAADLLVGTADLLVGVADLPWLPWGAGPGLLWPG
jgi:hypothetical protein